MRFGVLGTGVVGRAIAGRLAALQHDVRMGTRDPGKTRAVAEPDARGNPPFGAWVARHPGVGLATFAEAAAHAEIVVNATNGEVTLDVLHAAGEANLAGKVVIDVANPLDFSSGFPPTLFVKDTDSLAEQIQRAFPAARVVKALNTTNAAVMVDPGALSGANHSIFVCGNDAGAKAEVTALLRRFGWLDIIDLGDLTAARGAEMLLPLWLRLMQSLKTPIFNFRIVR
jgi:predicted dinucleotide-binding enzyme